jgi:ribosome maturation factor RimP
MNIAEKLIEYANAATENTPYFLVGTEASKKGGRITLLVDGDAGITIDACGKISRSISKMVDEAFGEDTESFVFEVSSPGADKALVLERQFPQHIGRDLTLEDKEGNIRTGKLMGIVNGEITLEESTKEKGKKKQIVTNTYKINEIKEPKVVLRYN